MYQTLYNPKIGFLAYIAGLIIMFNTAFLSALTATRFMYSCAYENHIIFSDFWKQLNSNKVPSNAIMVTALIAIAFSLFNNEVVLAIFTSFSLFIILISLCIALLILRWNERTNIDKQHSNNYILGNVNNIPILVVIQIIILVYLFYKILINKFYYNYI
jgi:L-asparagine transporter-like permease